MANKYEIMDIEEIGNINQDTITVFGSKIPKNKRNLDIAIGIITGTFVTYQLIKNRIPVAKVFEGIATFLKFF